MNTICALNFLHLELAFTKFEGGGWEFPIFFDYLSIPFSLFSRSRIHVRLCDIIPQVTETF